MPRKGRPDCMNWRDGLQQRLSLERLDAIVERADARQHHRARLGHFLRLPRDAHFRADLEQGLVDAAQVAGAVVNQSNHARRVVWGGGLSKLVQLAWPERRPGAKLGFCRLRRVLAVLPSRSLPRFDPMARYQPGSAKVGSLRTTIGSLSFTA